MNEDDAIAADDSVQRMAALLPELFCCRTLGDGFGQVVSAVRQSLENTGGAPLSWKQAQAVRWVMKELREKPFLGDERAGDLVEHLERVGLDPDPPELDVLVDFLDAESLR